MAVALVLLGCGARHRYTVSDVTPIDEQLRWPTVLVDVIDARSGGTERGALIEIRDSVHAHAAALGLSSLASPRLAAPETAEHVDAILERAAEAGAHELIFVREHQAREYLGSALALFEIIVVDPHTREILFERASLGCRRVPALPFAVGGHALRDALRRTIEDLFSAVVRSRAAGHPTRHAGALDDRLLHRPLARVEGDRVVGPGWSFARPPGWEVAGGLASASGGVRADDGAFASIVLEPTPQSARDYAYGNVSVLGEVGDVLAARELGADGSTLIVEAQLANGARSLQRITAIGGVGIVVTCAAPTSELLEAHRSECERVLESTRFEISSARER